MKILQILSMNKISAETLRMRINHDTFRMEYPINRFSMEIKRQLDVLDRRLKDNRGAIQ